jgi:uncharacterized protein (DUF302 family)
VDTRQGSVRAHFGFGTVAGVYERVEVDAAPEVVVVRLREALVARGLTEYAVVDHGRDMAAAGRPGIVAWTLVFGNPAAGANVLEHDLAAAADLPLRMGVIAAGNGHAAVVFRDMRTLLSDELAGVADAMTATLRALATSSA